MTYREIKIQDLGAVELVTWEKDSKFFFSASYSGRGFENCEAILREWFGSDSFVSDHESEEEALCFHNNVFTSLVSTGCV